jgi:uncharacterized protein YdhG (YjbR/CyaY superfamily)
MISGKEKPKTIDEYIAAAPKDAQDRLNEMLTCLREAAPGAEESLKWGQPALSYQWILFQFGAFKNHISLNPTPSVISTLQDKLKDYDTSSSTIRFPLDQPLPVTLIREIAALRIEESKKGVKWM